MMMIIACLCGRTEGAGKNEDPQASEEQAGSGLADGAVKRPKALRFKASCDAGHSVEKACYIIEMQTGIAVDWVVKVKEHLLFRD